jgi:HEAT repeat protein
MMALEALMASPSARSLPALVKLLEGDGSDELKESALFVLGQIEHPDATKVLLGYARNGQGETQLEAIRMIGINGNRETLAALPDIYTGGNRDVREAVLEAFLIADDVEGVFRIAMNAASDDDYKDAVEILGAMDAHAELARLREAKGISDALIDAYIISDNSAELQKLAMDDSNPGLQAEAVQAIGIVGGAGADKMLADIYASATDKKIKEAALEGLLIGDYDQQVLRLYRASTSIAEKRDLLETLVIMDSELAMEVIDAALAGDQ